MVEGMLSGVDDLPHGSEKEIAYVTRNFLGQQTPLSTRGSGPAVFARRYSFIHLSFSGTF